MKKHLAIFNPEVVKLIFSGQKTIDSRLSQKRIAPFGQVNVGDVVFIKPSGEDIKGQFKVKKVVYFEGLDNKDWDLIIKQYGKDILPIDLADSDLIGAEKFFKEKRETSLFGTLVFMTQVEQFLTSPITIKKRDRRAWVIL